MKHALPIVILAAAAALASGAKADGMPSAPVAAEAPGCAATWDGLYAAASVGYGIFVTDVRNAYHDDGLSYRASKDEDTGGITGTIAIGYDRQIRDGLVAGVFGDYTFGTIDERFDGFYPDEYIGVSYEDTWAVGARLGLVRCCSLWYVTAGYTQTSAELESHLHRVSEKLDGWFVGAGVEHQIRKGFALKLEYRYSDFEDAIIHDETFPCGSCGGLGYDRMDADNDMHAIRLGIVYRLHREDPPAPLK